MKALDYMVHKNRRGLVGESKTGEKEGTRGSNREGSTKQCMGKHHSEAH